MSKVGEKPITIPSGTTVTVADRVISIKGSEGEMTVGLASRLDAVVGDDQIAISRKGSDQRTHALHGLTRSLIANGIEGVNKKWEKVLEVVGTGFKVRQQGEELIFDVGYSHSVNFKSQPGVSFKVEGNKVSVAGVNKQLVGEVAYKIKIIRKPDPYKGKGIRYLGEIIKLKPGKKAKAA